jgi:glycosyltransferase involved in cell wall biosynthesis
LRNDVRVSESRVIAVNAAIIGERPTGLGVFALRVVEALDALGERLIIYTSLPEAILTREAQVRRLPAGVRPERGTVGHLTRLLWVQTGLRMRLARERPALLLNLMPDGLFFPSVPQIATIHDLIPLEYPQDHPRQQHYFRYYVPAVARRSRAIITISEASRREIVRVYELPAEKVHVVSCGYDSRRFNADGSVRDEAGREPYALYVGNIMPSKNLLRLVDAFAAATQRQRGRLVIRGRGKRQHVEALRARIVQHGLEGRVDWQPYVSDGALPELYRGARMLLLPSLSEGFGLTALEAMACGAPVIASNTSSLPEVVGDAGLLVDPLDIQALADAIGRLFRDDQLAKELRERGLARAPRFTWERVGQAVQGAIRAVLAERS